MFVSEPLAEAVRLSNLFHARAHRYAYALALASAGVVVIGCAHVEQEEP